MNLISHCNFFQPRVRRGGMTALTLSLAAIAGSLQAAEFADAEELLRQGDYAGCVAMAEEMIRERPYSLTWPLYLIEGLSTLGRDQEAETAVNNALVAESRSTRLRWLAAQVFRRTGKPDEAEKMIDQIIELTASRPWAYRDASDLVVFGRAALLRGADPKEVLDRVYATAKKNEPNHRDAYLATAELALDKGDYALAARGCREGLEKLPEDPDLHHLLARAYAPSEPTLAAAETEQALARNPKHLPSLLLLADHAIDAEEYEEAQARLAVVRSVNPFHQEAWALEAVVAALRNQTPQHEAALGMARKAWPGNPRVPHLIGLKLSQNYRFREGAEFQREALKLDADYFPARLQLAQDLLRLGDEGRGWQLAEQAHDSDGYSVLALNLVTLRDTLSQFATVTNEHFTLRMTPHEAAVYGERALALLDRARTTLCEKYRLQLDERVLVEVFPEQKDFAVRTFGMPENHGFLGVCFGPVITANSPASRPGQTFNWETMLWHEFCHVVTLHLTHNRMPRWLSEGISVYEERQANPAWGERMDPDYREMILGDELVPIADLSGAFLSPRSDKHLQFAYFESSLVVEYLVDRFGPDALGAILRDLGEGHEINATIERHTAPMTDLEPQFAAFAREQAKALAPDLDWEKPEETSLIADQGKAAWDIWAQTRPNNFYVLLRQAAKSIEAEDWAGALPVLESLVERFPTFTGPDSSWSALARAYRGLGDQAKERQALEHQAQIDDEAANVYERLMEIGKETGDWPLVIANANRYLAVNPLVPLPYRQLAQAAGELGEPAAAIGAYRALLALGPDNPAMVHYQLARQLHQLGDPAAKRHALQALEDAPRFRAALELLREINQAESTADGPAAEST
ncbi:MAG: hypothetical protein H7A46_13965 [Verrucomicrobiales bacterium]|nr:hypothetical protein [Verrucomicrobiales bacterium]